MNVLLLAAGAPRSDLAPGDYPLYLSELDGQLLVQRVVATFADLRPERFIFAFREEDIRSFHVDDIAAQLVANARIVSIRGPTLGAACTALLAIDHLQPDEELIIANATDLVDVDLGAVVASFRASGAAAGTLYFDSLHPRYSYVRLDSAGFVVEAAEKRPISRNATTGLFWFRRAKDFVAAAQGMIASDAQVGGSFYIAPTLNELILLGEKVAAWRIAAEAYHPLKSAQHVTTYEHLLDLAKAAE